MVEKYLPNGQADAIYKAAFLQGLMTDNKAKDIMPDMEKKALIPELWNDVKSIAANTPGALLGLGAMGLGAGVVGSASYNAIKERMSGEDPEISHANDIEAIYASRKGELEDAKWLSDVRAKRDALKKGYKKMTPEEYAKAYNELLDLLRERSDS